MANFLPDSIREQLKDGLLPSTESISFQFDNFFKDLTALVGRLRTMKNRSPRTIEGLGIAKLIKDRTGLNVSIAVDPAKMINAWIHLPQMDRNHPFYNNDWRSFFESKGVDMVKNAGGVISGWVDLQNAKVGGIYSDVQCGVFFTEGLLNYTSITDEEVTAILCHELGHLFTYFEVFGRTARTANIITAITTAMYEVEDQSKRTTLIKEAAAALHIQVDDPSDLASLPDGKRAEAVTTVFIAGAAAQARSDTGNPSYEFRSCEQLADQFAVKIGAGKYIATGLYKMYKDFNESSTTSYTKHVIIQAVGAVVSIGIISGVIFLNSLPVLAIHGVSAAGTLLGISIKYSIAIYIVNILLQLMFTNPLERVYDTGQQRVSFAKRSLTEMLKDRKLPESIKERTVKDIKELEAIEEKLQYKRYLVEYLITAFGPKGRKELKRETLYKDLENLVTNDLYTRSAELSLGA